MSKITKDMVISEILRIDRCLAPVLMGIGMHCLGCPSSQQESLADACMVHGVDTDEVVALLNAKLEEKA